VGITWASVKATNANVNWLRDEHDPCVRSFGMKKHPGFPTYPGVYDYPCRDDDRAARICPFVNSEFGRPFIAAPPG